MAGLALLWALSRCELPVRDGLAVHVHCFSTRESAGRAFVHARQMLLALWTMPTVLHIVYESRIDFRCVFSDSLARTLHRPWQYVSRPFNLASPVYQRASYIRLLYEEQHGKEDVKWLPRLFVLPSPSSSLDYPHSVVTFSRDRPSKPSASLLPRRRRQRDGKT